MGEKPIRKSGKELQKIKLVKPKQKQYKRVKEHKHSGEFFMALMKCKCGTVGYPLTKEAAEILRVVGAPKKK